MSDPKSTKASDGMAEGSVPAEVTDAEVEAWAARERQRREAWLLGPSAEERAEYAHAVRERRLADTFDDTEARISDTMRRGMRYGRESQLAAEGAVALFYRFSRRTVAELVKAGREWEEHTSLPTSLPTRRRRVSLDDEGS